MNKNQENILKLAKEKDISKMSFREIGRELDIKNPQTVIYHLGQLKRKGLIYIDTRNKQKVAKSEAFILGDFFSIPVVGSANCGPALEIPQGNIQNYLRISKKLLNRSNPNGLMVIKAVGDSLNRANIFDYNIEDGDYVIVDRNKQPENGDYVLSIIDDAANFKRFYKNSTEIKLVSESTLDIPPMILHEEDLKTSGYLINGTIIKVIKKPKNNLES